MSNDAWGELIDGDQASIAAWDRAWALLLHFRDDPMAELEPFNRDDESFALGPVFVATFQILGGTSPGSADLVANVNRARHRADAGGRRERAHVEALDLLVRGDFTEAALRWDTIAEGGLDLAAVRFAHDIYLHVGDADRRLQSSLHAVERWSEADPGYNFVLGQFAFALEEVGRYDEAEEVGRRSLDLDAEDLWAVHALAHVYESTGNQQAALDLLGGEDAPWHDQELLAVHIWWHLALRLVAAGDYDAALAVHDQTLPDATTPFRLCDLSSLLWRLELVGVDVGDRWDTLVDRWAGLAERHTCGFIDLHASLAFFRRPGHAGAEAFWTGLAGSHRSGASQNTLTFDEVVRPLVGAFRSYASGDHGRAIADLDSLTGEIHRIGGSIAQRELIELTRTKAVQRLRCGDDNQTGGPP